MTDLETEGPGPPTGYDVLEGTDYRSLRRLGAGGMGEVYLVEHRRTFRKLVAKLLHPQLADRPSYLERMRMEAEALGQLDDPNVVKIVDVAETPSRRPFIVMEFLEGRTLGDELAARGRLPVLEALEIARQILSALVATHAIGLVHRDIKPDNIFLCRGANGRHHVKLLDFGVVRVMPGTNKVDPLPATLATGRGLVLGTPRFASPEAAAGLEVDPRADLYAVALVIYEMLTGRGPFDEHQYGADLLAAHVNEEPKPPSFFATDPVPPELDRIVMKGLSKDPDERFQSAEQLRGLLEKVFLLLQKPTGWLQTSVFNIKEADAAPAPERTRPRRARPIARPTTPPMTTAPIEVGNRLSPTAATSAGAGAPSSRSAVVMVFVFAALVGGAIALGLASLIARW